MRAITAITAAAVLSALGLALYARLAPTHPWPLQMLVLVLVIACAAGIACAGYLLTSDADAPAFAPAAPTPIAVSSGPGPAVAERERLVRAVIEVRAQTASTTMAAQLDSALRSASVEAVSATPGEPFDPRRHRAVDTTPTSDPAMDGRIAATERPGYVDRNVLVEPPSVIVYRVGGPG